MHSEFPSGQVFPSFTMVVPYDGDIILFPSWLSHGTTKSKSDVERISIAFNLVDPQEPGQRYD